MSNRKISNEALKATLVDAQAIIVEGIAHQKWLAKNVWACVSFTGTIEETHKKRDGEIAKSIDRIAEMVRTSRDIDHALAALEQEVQDG
jgi:hypothetical protein